MPQIQQIGLFIERNLEERKNWGKLLSEVNTFLKLDLKTWFTTWINMKVLYCEFYTRQTWYSTCFIWKYAAISSKLSISFTSSSQLSIVLYYHSQNYLFHLTAIYFIPKTIYFILKIICFIPKTIYFIFKTIHFILKIIFF